MDANKDNNDGPPIKVLLSLSPQKDALITSNTPQKAGKPRDSNLLLENNDIRKEQLKLRFMGRSPNEEANNFLDNQFGNENVAPNSSDSTSLEAKTSYQQTGNKIQSLSDKKSRPVKMDVTQKQIVSTVLSSPNVNYQRKRKSTITSDIASDRNINLANLSKLGATTTLNKSVSDSNSIHNYYKSQISPNETSQSTSLQNSQQNYEHQFKSSDKLSSKKNVILKENTPYKSLSDKEVFLASNQISILPQPDISLTNIQNEFWMNEKNLMLTEINNLKSELYSFKELKYEMSTLEELKKELAEEKKLNKQNTENLNKINDENKSLREKIEANKKIIARLLISETENYKEERAKNINKNNYEIGSFINERKGMEYEEVWRKGKHIISLENSIKQNFQLREDIDKKRKKLTKDIKTSINNNKDIAESFFMNEIDLLKNQLISLKKEEQDLNSKLDATNAIRYQHMIDNRMITMEKNSRFSTGHYFKNEQFMLLYGLGRGGFSEVFKGYDFERNCYMACKIHQVSSEWKEERARNYIDHSLREFRIHKKLNHPNIVKLYDVFVVDFNTFASVMEFCHTDLDIILKKNGCLSERESRTIMIQVISALKYLNELKPSIIHYDLKPANILFVDYSSYNPHIKLTDFGLSKIMPINSGNNFGHLDSNEASGMELTSQGAGTYWYLPPECFIVGDKPPLISSKVDVWSVGVIFFQSIFGFKPIAHNQSQPTIVKNNTILNTKNITFPAKPTASNETKDFIKLCMTYDKDIRPNVLKLAETNYVTRYTSLENLANSKI